VDFGAKVINMSLGWYQVFECPTGESSPVYTSPSLDASLQYAVDHDVVLIAAMGNENQKGDFICPGPVHYAMPAADSRVISVTAVDQNDVKAGFANYADWCDISAPSDAISTFPLYLDVTPPIGYSVDEGTSISAPFVSGVAALIRSYAPAANRIMVKNILKQTADNIDAVNTGYVWEGKIGAGRLNAHTALNLIQNVPSTPTGVSMSTINNNPSIIWNANSEADIKGYNVHVVYEFRNGSNPKFWTHTETDYFVTTPSYRDVNWSIGGNDMAYYYVQAVDIIDNWSVKSNTVSSAGGLYKTTNDSLIGTINNKQSELKVSTFPNPFNGQVTIQVNLHTSGYVEASIYNIQGQLVSTISKNSLHAGNHYFVWDGKSNLENDSSSGLFILRIVTPNTTITQKLILMR